MHVLVLVSINLCTKCSTYSQDMIGPQNLKWVTYFFRFFVIHMLRCDQPTSKCEVSISYEGRKGDAKYRKWGGLVLRYIYVSMKIAPVDKMHISSY